MAIKNAFKIVLIIMIVGTFLPHQSNADEPFICNEMHLRSHVDDMKHLENCEVIGGPLSIALMDNSEVGAFEKLSFPKLKYGGARAKRNSSKI